MIRVPEWLEEGLLLVADISHGRRGWGTFRALFSKGTNHMREGSASMT